MNNVHDNTSYKFSTVMESVSTTSSSVSMEMIEVVTINPSTLSVVYGPVDRVAVILPRVRETVPSVSARANPVASVPIIRPRRFGVCEIIAREVREVLNYPPPENCIFTTLLIMIPLGLIFTGVLIGFTLCPFYSKFI